MTANNNVFAKKLLPADAAVGAALGTLAGKFGLDQPGVKDRRVRGKFATQNKHRLPRKEKKRIRSATAHPG